MEKQSYSITLGYDGSGWTSAEVEAEIRSVSEPDRKVPLMMQLVGTPDIFEWTIGEGAKDTVKAKISLKSGATVPQNCQGSIELIADPATEIMSGMMQAMSPIPVPGLQIPQMRATVNVKLVPYDLRLKWNDSEVYADQAVQLDGDGQSKGKLTAEVVKVDGKGNPVGEPLAAKFTLTAKFEEAEWVKVQQSSGGKSLKADFSSSKLCLEQANKTLGPVVVEALVDGHTVRKKLSLELCPITLTLVKPEVTELKPEELGKAEVRATNAKGQAVPGVKVSWSMSPELGTLSATEGVTDAQGVASVSYTAPTIDLLTGKNEAVTITATAGAEKEWQDQLSFTLLYVRSVTISFSKEGFQSTTRTFQVTQAGPLTLTVGVAEYPFTIGSAVAKCGEITAASDSYGRISLPLTEAGTGQDLGKVEIPLSPYCAGLITKLDNDLARLTTTDFTTSHLDRCKQSLEKFSREDYVKRLAKEPEESFKNTMDNFKVLAATVRVADKNRGLFRRRFQYLTKQLEAFFINLAGAVFSVFGDKIFAKLADYLGAAARRLFGWMAGKLSGSKRILKWAGKGTKKLKALLSSVDDKIKALRSRLSSAGAPPEVTKSIPRSNMDGPFPKGDLMDMKAFKEGLEEAKALLKGAQSKLDDLTTQLNKAKTHLASCNEGSNNWKKWNSKIRKLNSKVGSAKKLVEQNEKLVQAAVDSEATAVFEELLESIFGCLNRVLLMSQLAVAYCCGCALEIAEAASKKALRKSFGAIADDNAITAIFTDKIYKPIFQLATGSWVGPGIATVLEKRLVQMQSNGIASTLEDALQRTQAWTDRDIEAAKDALEFYYTEVDAATFVVESEEITNEAVFDLLDWVEFTFVWGVRIANVILGILSLLTAWFSMGASVLAYMAVSAGLTAFAEILDTLWDCLKAIIKGYTSVSSLFEMMATVLPAHGQFASKAYGDDSLFHSAVRGWGEVLDGSAALKPSSKAPGKLQKALGKVDKLKKDQDGWIVSGVKFVKDNDVVTIVKGE